MTRSDAVFAVVCVFFVLATVFVAMRMVSRLVIVKRVDWDDFLMAIAWVLAFVLSFSVMFATRKGLGMRDADIKPAWQMALKRAEYTFSITYNPVLMATKSSILILYLRISSADRFFRYSSYFLLIIVNVAGMVLTFLNIFQCRPVSAAVRIVSEGEAKCIDLVFLYLCSAPVNIITDLAIILLPLPILTGIRMERKQKIAVIGTFCTGIFVAVVDVIRIAYLQTAVSQELRQEAMQNDRLPDFAYHASLSFMWSAVEVNTGIVCACVLVLKPLMKKINPSGWRDGPRMSMSAQGGLKLNTGAADRGGAPFGDAAKSPVSPRSPRPSNGGLLLTPMMGVGQITPSIQQQNNPIDDVEAHDYAAGAISPMSEKPRDMLGLGINGFQMGDDGDLGSGNGAGNGNGSAPRGKTSEGARGRSASATSRPLGSVPEEGHGDDEDEIYDPELGQTDTGFRRINLDDMDIMDFLALEETDIEEVKRMNAKECQNSADMFQGGTRIVRQPTAVSAAYGMGAGAPGQGRERRLTSQTAVTGVSECTQGPENAFSDFVKMTQYKPLTKLTKREAFWPIMSVSILFFLWGFAYGLLGTLNGRIEALLTFNDQQAIALHGSYWTAYFLGPSLIGYWVLTRAGFKATFITGLGLYACGAMSFWPSSVMRSFAGFFISNLIIASGLSCLEVAANLYVAIAGPDELSEARLNYAQGIQGLASVVSPILAQKALFTGVVGVESLVDTQWCYLAVSLVVIFLSVVFFYLPLNEASDDALEELANERVQKGAVDGATPIMGIKVRDWLAGLGILCMLLYVGAQESTSYWWYTFIPQIRAGATSSDAFDFQAIGHGIFAFSRFAAAGLCYIGFPPRILLAICVAGCVATSTLTIALPGGNAPVAFGILNVFFEAPIFPTIFAMALRNQGRRTKLISTGLTMAISGGTIWPSVAYAIYIYHGRNTRLALALVPAVNAVALCLPIMSNFFGRFRRHVDPIWPKKGGMDEEPRSSIEEDSSRLSDPMSPFHGQNPWDNKGSLYASNEEKKGNRNHIEHMSKENG